jgi:WhiB family redox-sensing transcriptional regulator
MRRRRGRPPAGPAGPEALLAAMLVGAPALPGARCRGRGHLFDPPGPGEHPDAVQARHHQAVQLCNGCPSLTRCADWLDTLPPRQRPRGVIAGRIATMSTPRTNT